jgi:hypothetical protein
MMPTQPITGSAAPVDGVAWLQEWEMPFEGGYSLLLKFAWANGAAAADLCHAIFERKLVGSNPAGRHSRSLMDTAWVDPRSKGVTYLRDKVVDGSLVSRAGKWCSYIAADQELRYCSTCLRSGYQSALFQIDGMRECPIHAEPLQSVCTQCGAKTPRYALTEAGFSTPFFCETCSSPLAGAFDPKGWGDPSLREALQTLLSPIAQWLETLSASSLNWKNWDEWHFPLRWHCSEAERRVAALQTLLKALPPESRLKGLNDPTTGPLLFSGSIVSSSGTDVDHSGTHWTPSKAERTAIYKAIRRRVVRKLSGCRSSSSAIRPLPQILDGMHSDGAILLSLSACPRAQALALWRLHVEEVERDPHVLAFRPAVLQWPGDTEIDAAGWAGYLMASFHAAVSAFDAWRTQAMRIPDANIYGTDRPRARALHAQYAPLLSPEQLPSFPAVSVLTFTDVINRPRLFVVGPGDPVRTGVAESVGPSIWCRCRYRASLSSVDRETARTPLEFRPSASQSVAACPVTLAYIAPLARLKLPPELDGSADQEVRKKRRCLLPAMNDLQAIEEWLNGFESARTRYAYRIQIEKALTWAVAQQQKPLSALTAHDATTLLGFLQDPVPREVWLPSTASTAAKRWTPFRKAASRRSSDYTLSVLSLLFEHWCDRGYVLSNPCKRRIRRTADSTPPFEKVYAPRDAMVTPIEWAYIWRAAQSQCSNEARVILALAYFSALLPDEIAAIQVKAIKRIELDPREDSILSVTISARPPLRQEVFLLPVLAHLLTPFFPVDRHEFEAYITERGDVYLMDVIDQSSSRRPGAATRGPTASRLFSKIGGTLTDAIGLAEAAEDVLGARRLKQVSLNWVSQAFEQHLHQGGVRTVEVWDVIAAMRLIPPVMREYLPNRTRVDPGVLRQSIHTLQSFHESQG